VQFGYDMLDCSKVVAYCRYLTLRAFNIHIEQVNTGDTVPKGRSTQHNWLWKDRYVDDRPFGRLFGGGWAVFRGGR
jgi:hypothetical protein